MREWRKAPVLQGSKSERGKRVQALGGAKNHAVVLPDADMDFAADHITAADHAALPHRRIDADIDLVVLRRRPQDPWILGQIALG